jgi:hypothetical protein
MELALILVMPLAQAPSFIMESMSSFRTPFFLQTGWFQLILEDLDLTNN